ncbi:MAG: zinc-ribbon domain-containing protein [Candidatus Methanogranum gryphiswaldense]|nr:MAG: zinc-ribbon domain-containing protein [Candidatus Methanogranum sp. U3.2.1]
MKTICPECGNEIPENSEFCHHCGRSSKSAIKLDDKGNVVQGNNICKTCGCDINPGDLFCQHCGATITKDQMTSTFRPKLNKSGIVGIILALGPGFFNIFGLGHLWFRSYKRAAIYLVISVPLFYLTYYGNLTSYYSTILFLASIFIYFIQAMEALTLAFMPRQQKKIKKE